MIESMAAGVPMVQPKLGAFPEIIQLTEGGLIYNDNSPEALSEALKQLLDDPEKLSALSKNARKGVERHFSIDAHSQEMIDVYQSLLK
jgi:glycosyltransferase involved in cell wall biosynthesis